MSYGILGRAQPHCLFLLILHVSPHIFLFTEPVSPLVCTLFRFSLIGLYPPFFLAFEQYLCYDASISFPFSFFFFFFFPPLSLFFLYFASSSDSDRLFSPPSLLSASAARISVFVSPFPADGTWHPVKREFPSDSLTVCSTRTAARSTLFFYTSLALRPPFFFRHTPLRPDPRGHVGFPPFFSFPLFPPPYY